MPPTSSVTSPPARKNPKDLLLVGSGVALILVIVGMFFVYRHSSVIPHDYHLTISSNELPLAPAALFTNGATSVTPVTVTGQGTASVFDVAEDAGHGYYLLGNGSRTNLYRQDHANVKAGLEELTHSDSLKFDLSYDATSGVAAYVSVAKDGSRHVMVWSPLTKKETDLGAGLHPVLLPGGFFVVLERAGKLVSVRVETNDAYDLLPLAADSVVAVDAAEMKVALYDPKAHMIKEFSVANSVGASYTGGVASENKPLGLFYVDGALVTASKGEGGSIVLTGKNGLSITLPVGTLPAHYKLSIHHD